jgi:hypothetical protein
MRAWLLQPLPSFHDALATSKQTAEFYTRRKPLSATINTLANALYKVRQQRWGAGKQGAPECGGACSWLDTNVALVGWMDRQLSGCYQKWKLAAWVAAWMVHRSADG